MESRLKILIPVDLNEGALHLIDAACNFLNGKGLIHLLYVQYYGYPLLSFSAARFIHPNKNDDRKRAIKRLESYKKHILQRSKELEAVYTINDRENVQRGIESAGNSSGYDLIIIGKGSCHKALPFLHTVRPEKIAGRTGIPVLIIGAGKNTFPFNKITLKDEDIPDHQILETLKLFSLPKNTEVMLINFNAKIGESLPTGCSLYPQYISQGLGLRTRSRIESKKFSPRSILKIARKLHSDLVILKATTGTKLNWLGSQVYDEIRSREPLQLLIVK